MKASTLTAASVAVISLGAAGLTFAQAESVDPKTPRGSKQDWDQKFVGMQLTQLGVLGASVGAFSISKAMKVGNPGWVGVTALGAGIVGTFVGFGASMIID